MGRGGFNDVYEVLQLENNDRIEKASSAPKYAIKFLSESTMTNPRSFKCGAADLMKETKLLSSLDHPNIVKLRGICDKGAAGFASGVKGGYFILLDLFQETLDMRIDQWRKEDLIRRKEDKKFRSLIRRVITHNSRSCQKRRFALAQRIECASRIASAIKYLHDNNIMYRDLKPTNIGIDHTGNTKIFDFGIAKELHAHERLENGLYKMTGRAGSLRYMAPEVAQKKRYNLSADIYSFSILLWEICSLDTPFKKMNSCEHDAKVVHGTHRPRIDSSWSSSLRFLMKNGWSANIQDRPNIQVCYDILQSEMMANLDGGVFVVDDDESDVTEHTHDSSHY